ncbi:aspartate aminotransferase family protein [Micromonospora sp. KC606]|uniref:aminotransferase class III-fold pyridoxal phosphate-dependent enzyme n=1 Tax=Micromonospora sp. KC606 TaxID=2530379 RepID=UPI00104883C7|nr:aminotransferase class III-fold pyridoxal phosphate-dependent enzyme [Micromonospora sp. KC606]TDC82872.1 aspartate aminotransferase family protein [Micromonospora sp. KC606]
MSAPGARGRGAPHGPQQRTAARRRSRRWSGQATRQPLRLAHLVAGGLIEGSALNSTCGYAHPAVVRSLAEQASRLQHVDLSLSTHELAGVLAERLAAYLPGPLNRTLLVNSGSEGFDAAVLMAVQVAGHAGHPRSRIVSSARGYQGATLLSRSLSSLPRNRHPLPAPLPVTLVELPVPPRQLRRPESLPLLLEAFSRAIDADPADPPAAVVVEPFLNVGGGVVLPDGFLPGLRRLCDEAGALLVVDEVFTAYGRCGRMFAVNREDVIPDIVVTSKGLAGGYAAIPAVTVTDRVYDSFSADPVIGGLRYGHTTSGHAVACAADLLPSAVRVAYPAGRRLAPGAGAVGTCVDLAAHGWGNGRAKSARNTASQPARLYTTTNCTGTSYQIMPGGTYGSISLQLQQRLRLLSGGVRPRPSRPHPARQQSSNVGPRQGGARPVGCPRIPRSATPATRTRPPAPTRQPIVDKLAIQDL